MGDGGLVGKVGILGIRVVGEEVGVMVVMVVEVIDWRVVEGWIV